MAPPIIVGGYYALMEAGAAIGGYMFWHAGNNIANKMNQDKAQPLSDASSPGNDSAAAGQGAKDKLSGNAGDCGTGNCDEPRTNDPIKDKDKLERQMKKRGWTQEQIQDAIQNGEQHPETNYQTGGPATRYVGPQTGQSVIIDNQTGGIIHVGGPNYKY